MVIFLAPYIRERRKQNFIKLSRYFRQQGCSFREAATFAKQTLMFGQHYNTQVIPYGPPANLPH